MEPARYTLDQLYVMSDRVGDRLAHMELAGEEGTNIYKIAEENFAKIEKAVEVRIAKGLM